MIKRMVTSAVFAGFAAGLIAALLHFAFVQKDILLAEQYETGALVHSPSGTQVGGPSDAPSDAHSSDSAAAVASDAAPNPAHVHAHSDDTTSEAARNMLTVLFMGIVYTSYALLLTAGFALAGVFGRNIDGLQGLLWGLGGFAAFQLAPAMGLAPELPGTIAADLGARQIWWWSTVLATAAGLGLLAYGPKIGGRKIWTVALAAALLALPHGIGAPEIGGYFGVTPPELAARFAARVLGAGLVVWAILGWLAGHFWAKSAQE